MDFPKWSVDVAASVILGSHVLFSFVSSRSPSTAIVDDPDSSNSSGVADQQVVPEHSSSSIDSAHVDLHLQQLQHEHNPQEASSVNEGGDSGHGEILVILSEDSSLVGGAQVTLLQTSEGDAPRMALVMPEGAAGNTAPTTLASVATGEHTRKRKSSTRGPPFGILIVEHLANIVSRFRAAVVQKQKRRKSQESKTWNRWNTKSQYARDPEKWVDRTQIRSRFSRKGRCKFLREDLTFSRAIILDILRIVGQRFMIEPEIGRFPFPSASVAS